MKKICSLILTLTMLFTLSGFVFADEDDFPVPKSVKNIVIDGQSYQIASRYLSDNFEEFTVINPDSSQERYSLIDNKLYDSDNNLIATFHEEKAFEKIDGHHSVITRDFISYVNSATSPYPVSDYTKYIGYTKGNVQLAQNIQTITTGALALIVGIVAPSIGFAMSAMLIAQAIKTDINQSAIFYKKYEYHHKYLLNTAKMFKVQWYWDPSFTVKAGIYQSYYSTLM